MLHEGRHAKLPPMPLFEPDYTFKHFVVTPNNELAFAAAAAIAKDPGSRYNPFFLYGDFGSGKTHLLHAVGNAIREEGTPGMRIMYVTGKDFAADMPRTRISCEKSGTSLERTIVIEL
jgi:chromosomal replication initiator protein